MKIVARLLALSFLMGTAIAASACCNMNPDPASTAKCKSSDSSDHCSECCKKEGRNGHTYTGGGGCACL